MPQAFPYTRAALVLAEAEVFGDKKAREKHGVPRRTLWDWRQRAKKEPKLAERVSQEIQELLRGWRNDTILGYRAAIATNIDFLKSIKPNGDPKTLLALNDTLRAYGDLVVANVVLEEDEPRERSPKP